MHTHILFGVDDGCRSLSESIEMIKKAIVSGVTDLVLTPHFSAKRRYVVSKEELKEKFNILQEELINQNLSINLYLGNEIDEHSSVIDEIRNNVPLTLNNTKYVLIDFGMHKSYIDDVIYELKVSGVKTIVAHPERYNYIDYDMIKSWKKTGALIQLNAGSLFGNKDVKKIAKQLIKRGLVDIVASDAHRNPDSFEYLRKAYEYVSAKVSKTYADIIFTFNPEQLKGQEFNQSFIK